MARNSGDAIVIMFTAIVLFVLFAIMATGSKEKSSKKFNSKLINAYNLKKECVNSCLNPNADIVGCEMQCGRFPYQCYINCIGMIGDKDKCFAKCTERGEDELDQSDVPDNLLDE